MSAVGVEKQFGAVGGVLSGLVVGAAVSEAISTGCAPIDSLLGGGLERGTITQVYGPPAAGKTNLALSAAVEVAAAGDRTVYIDTEGLSLDRFTQMAAEKGDPDEIGERLVISEVHDFEEQREAVREATELAGDADLIVLDSATGFYRLERTGSENGEALRAVARQLTTLLGVARRHELAVLVTNQVYTDPDSDQAKPLGGHTLAHWTGVVLRLDRFRGGQRRARLEKHRSQPAGGTTRFSITASGLAGAESRETP